MEVFQIAYFVLQTDKSGETAENSVNIMFYSFAKLNILFFERKNDVCVCGGVRFAWRL